MYLNPAQNAMLAIQLIMKTNTGGSTSRSVKKQWSAKTSGAFNIEFI
jgi:hypothetical protein